MPFPNKQFYTLEDIYALPDEKRAELIDGQIYDMTPPTPSHQRISFALSRAIADYIEAHGGNCEVFPAPFAVFLTLDDKTYLEPDISVICDQNKISDRGCEGAPDWIIEIVSPSSRRMDYYKKNTLYADAGVREYWIVDPLRQRTMVCNFEKNESPIMISFDQAIQSGIYDDLEIIVGNFLKQQNRPGI